MIKKIIKKILPKALINILKGKPKYGFFGNYKNWQDALSNTEGYDSQIILEKVKKSSLKVKNGQAAYERDSVVFYKEETSAILPYLEQIAKKDGYLGVLDFGGALGSSYFQNRKFLSNVRGLSWNIIEQKNFVDCGKQFFEDSILKFYETIEESVKAEKINVCLLSSVIQYLPEPYTLLEKLISFDIPYIILDRTAFLKNSDRITVQKVRPGIYDASYPAWFLNEQKVLTLLKQKYTVEKEFSSLRDKIILEDTTAMEKGFVFKRNLSR